MAAAKASIPTASGTDSSLWDHMRQSPMAERPLWKVLLAPVFERCKFRSAIECAESGGGPAGVLVAPAFSRPMAVTVLKP